MAEVSNAAKVHATIVLADMLIESQENSKYTFYISAWILLLHVNVC